MSWLGCESIAVYSTYAVHSNNHSNIEAIWSNQTGNQTGKPWGNPDRHWENMQNSIQTADRAQDRTRTLELWGSITNISAMWASLKFSSWLQFCVKLNMNQKKYTWTAGARWTRKLKFKSVSRLVQCFYVSCQSVLIGICYKCHIVLYIIWCYP